jgi:hypothetical protein
MVSISDEMKITKSFWSYILSVSILAGGFMLFGKLHWESGDEFMVSYGLILWSTCNALIVFVVSIFSWQVFRQPQSISRRLGEIVVSLAAVHLVGFSVALMQNKGEDSATLMLFTFVFYFLPASLASLVTFLLLAFVSRLVRGTNGRINS